MQMRKLVILSLLVAGACTKVEPGYVAVVVNNYGSQRGVKDFPIRTGAVWYNIFTEDVYKFPTFSQNYLWSKNPKEGSDNDESFTVNSIEGAKVNFDIGASITFEPDSVPRIFVQYRKDADHIIMMNVRSQVRDAFSRHASRMKVTDIFGIGKQSLQDSVLADMKKVLSPQGIHITQLSMIGEMRVDPEVQRSIQAVLQAAQRAIEAQNKVVQAQAEADQMVKTARGDSASAVIRAQGMSEANKLLRVQLTPELIQYEMIKKWNGIVPVVASSGNLLDIRGLIK